MWQEPVTSRVAPKNSTSMGCIVASRVAGLPEW
jgi:hypothetical protein